MTCQCKLTKNWRRVAICETNHLRPDEAVAPTACSGVGTTALTAATQALMCNSTGSVSFVARLTRAQAKIHQL